jgi:glycosyltransferase involved in cell wall biosynthesis
LCCPSRAEPFGLVLLEAAYHKKGIVGTSVGGVPEIIANGVNGLLVEPDDPAGMAAQVESLLRNPEFAERLGNQVYATLIAGFCGRIGFMTTSRSTKGANGPGRSM